MSCISEWWLKKLNLDTLYHAIQGNLRENKFVFCDRALGYTGAVLETFLECALSLRELLFENVSCQKQSNVVELVGEVKLSQQSTAATVLFTQKRDVILAKLTICWQGNQPFHYFSSRAFVSEQMKTQYLFPLEQGAEYDFLVTGQIAEPIGYGDLLLVLLELAADECCASPTEFDHFQLSYGRQFRYGRWVTLAGVQSQAVVKLTDQISMGKLGIQVVRSQSVCDLRLSGEVQLAGKVLPVRLWHQAGTYLMGITSGEDNTPSLSLLDLGKLAQFDLAEQLPEFFAKLLDLQLKRFLLCLADDFSKIQAVELQVASGAQWSFFGIPQVLMCDLLLHVELDFSDKVTHSILQIEGTLEICGLALRLCARREEKGFTFQGMFPSGQALDLSKMMEEFVRMLDAGALALPVPTVLLKGVTVTFCTAEEKRFELSAFVHVEESGADSSLASQLLNIEAKLEVKSCLVGAKRTFSGSLNGALDVCGQSFHVSFCFDTATGGTVISAAWQRKEGSLTLELLLSAFGISELPDAVRRLPIALSGVTLSYSLLEKKLSCTLESEAYGRLEAVIQEDTTGCRYLVKICCSKPISLSGIPVISTMVPLEQTKIESLVLHAASADFPAEQVKQGVGLDGSFLVGGNRTPFTLAFTEAPKAEYGGRDGNGAVEKWFDLYKTLGVLELHRIAISYLDGYAGFLLDASLAANPVRFDVMGAGFGLSLSDPSKVRFSLEGMGLSYQSDTLSIAGAFHVGRDGAYDGQILVKTKPFSLYAIGSYQQGSLFAFGVVNASFGGPPPFFVTGIAIGFGYNRSLSLPPIESVASFPMVSGAMGKINQSQLQEQMKDKIKPSRGDNFLSAGIRFTSFQLLDSFALLNVAFGSRLEISVLGLSEVTIPPHTAQNPIAYAQLALRAVCAPEDGFVTIMAQLTPESYILSRDCKLTGGFACSIWFAGAHKGDFVVTLGGYHPAYQKPEHYPEVPRLGFHWNITKELTLSGGVYFALTPSCLMAGAALDAVFQSGELRAWFHARADFLLGWKPFYYDCSLYIGLGASYRLKLFWFHVTLSVELSAALDLWGPDFTGVARITWFIISFTIRFGHAQRGRTWISWEDFERSFLPNTAVAEENGGVQTNAITVSKGLLETDESDAWIVDAETLRLEVRSAVPATELCLNGNAVHHSVTRLGVLPMGENQALSSSYSIRVTRENEAVNLRCTPLEESVPGAMWGLQDHGMNGGGLIPNVMVGAALESIPAEEFPALPPDRFLDLAELVIVIGRTFSWSHPSPLIGPVYPQENPLAVLANSIMTDNTCQKRKDLTGAFEKLGYAAEQEISLTRLSGLVGSLFFEDVQIQTLL